MAQSRFWNYKDDDYTLRMNHRDRPFREAGRYRGFSGIEAMGGMQFDLRHDGADSEAYYEIGLGLNPSNNLGVCLSPMGVVITEDEKINALQTSDTLGTDARIDIIVCSHEYTLAVGGSTAVYTIVEGIPDPNPVAPSVINPFTDTIIGYLNIPADTDTLTDSMYEFAPIPNFAGDDTIAHVERAQYFTANQHFSGLYGDFGWAVLNGTVLELGVPVSGFFNYPARPDAMCFYLWGVSPTPSSGYNPVLTVNGGQNLPRQITIHTVHNLKFVQGSTIQTPESSGCYVKENTTFQMTSTEGAWLVATGSEARTNTVNKFRKVQSLSSETSATLSSGAVNRISQGNTIYLTNLNTVKWVEAEDYSLDVPEVGTILTLVNRNLSDVLIETALSFPIQTAAPSGYKRILNPSGDFIVLASGGSITIIEESSYWKVIAKNGDKPYYRDCTHLELGNRGSVSRPQVALHNGVLKFRGSMYRASTPNWTANVGFNAIQMPTVIDTFGKYLMSITSLSSSDNVLQIFSTNALIGGSAVPIIISCDVASSNTFTVAIHPNIPAGNTIEIFLGDLTLNTYYP